MQVRHVLCGLGLSVTFAAAVQAAPATIWVDNASFGAPIIQEYDVATGALITQITAPHGNNGRGMVTVGDVCTTQTQATTMCMRTTSSPTPT